MCRFDGMERQKHSLVLTCVTDWEFNIVIVVVLQLEKKKSRV